MYHMIIMVEGYFSLRIRETQKEPVSNSDIEYWEKWYTAKYEGKQATVINVYYTEGE